MEKLLDYIDRRINRINEWFNRGPLWAQLLVFPMLCVLSLAMLPFWIFVALPNFIIGTTLEYRCFWRRLRERGQVAKWSEVAPAVDRKASTLVVEVCPKGPVCSWWIDRPRAEVDPDCVVPSWQDYEERNLEVFVSEAIYDQVEQWAIHRLAAYESSARAVAPSWTQLRKLGADTKREAVLVMQYLDKVCLSTKVLEWEA